MAKRRAWVEDALRLMERRGYTSSELEEELKHSYRYGPNAKEITLVLKHDDRFQIICRASVGSLIRTRSHEVPVFGLAAHRYELTHSFQRI